MASLIEFHKWDKENPCRCNYNKRLSYYDMVNRYQDYLKTALKMPCCDNGVWSHWGPNAHRIECHWDMSDIKTKEKSKRIDIRQWLQKNHPKILKEFAQKWEGK